MGDFARNNCKRIARIAEMEIEESSSTRSFSKKMKADFDFDNFEKKLNLPPLNFELDSHCFFSVSSEKIFSPVTSWNSSAGVFSGDFCSGDSSPASSCCSSNECSEVVKDDLRFVDLEAKGFETESSTSIINIKLSTGTTPPSPPSSGDIAEDMDSQGKNCRRKSPSVTKMPTQAEIDEFFTVAEKKEQKRFAEKYNYDIVKDVPLDGRYQWVRLKP